MRIKEFFNKKINVAWVTAVLIMIAILTICVATSHSKYVLEKELTFSLGIIESEEWNKRTLIAGEALNHVLNEVLKDAEEAQVVFGFEDDFLTEIEGIEGTAVGIEDTTKEFSADDIKIYKVTDTENNITTAYILSDYQIKANANSSKMFYNYETLTNIFFLNFETSIVENMDSMFYGCKNLTELDLSKFETPKLTNIANMFYDDILLETIYVSELWDISGIETTQDNVFYNCVKLKGGNGTTYNEVNPIISSDYACIDTAEDGETPATLGYFTYKSSVTEQQVTFNLVRPNATEKNDMKNTSSSLTTTNTNTDTTNSNETTTPSNTTTNNDDTKKETETGTENKDKIETDTDTNTESNNTDSNVDTSLDDNSNSNNSDNTTEESEGDKEDTEPVEDQEKVEDEKVEDTTGENIESVESKETENTSVE